MIIEHIQHCIRSVVPSHVMLKKRFSEIDTQSLVKHKKFFMEDT
jgi:hypothetical protein